MLKQCVILCKVVYFLTISNGTLLGYHKPAVNAEKSGFHLWYRKPAVNVGKSGFHPFKNFKIKDPFTWKTSIACIIYHYLFIYLFIYCRNLVWSLLLWVIAFHNSSFKQEVYFFTPSTAMKWRYSSSNLEKVAFITVTIIF